MDEHGECTAVELDMKFLVDDPGRLPANQEAELGDASDGWFCEGPDMPGR